MAATRKMPTAIALLLTTACWCLAGEVPLAAGQEPTEPSGLSWETSLEAAQRRAAESGRLVLVHFGAPWCAPCRRMEQVFSQPGFGRELDQHFVAVKLNRDHYPATARRLGVDAIPADVVLTPDGQVLHRMQGARSAERYIATLLAVVDEARRPDQAVAQDARNAANAQTNPPPVTTDAPGAPSPPNPDIARGTPRRPPRNTGTAWDDPASAQPPNAMAQATVAQGNASAAREQAPRPAKSRQTSAAPQRQAPPIRQEDLPPDSPPLALDGYCPVTLCLKKRWTIGDVRYGAVHRGRTYLFAGPQEQQEFLANPDRYSPVLKGHDPVLALDEHRLVPGERRYGLFCGGRIYLFSGEQTLQTFARNPQRYMAEAVQAQR